MGMQKIDTNYKPPSTGEAGEHSVRASKKTCAILLRLVVLRAPGYTICIVLTAALTVLETRCEMRANAKTVIVHPDAILVPYRTEHVAKYHEWMTSAELRELTASEPLTLEEEYEMQRKWQTDEDKLTFIVLSGTSSDLQERTKLTPETLSALPMIGDVNLFFKGSPGEEDFEVEAEIMIAEPAYRRRGLAYTALQLMLSYATDPLSPSPLPVPKDRLVARIGDKNEPSIRLFEKLGFSVTKRVAVFEEVELRYTGVNEAPWTTGVIRTLDD